MKTDVRILEVVPHFSGETLRTPLKFGAGLVREITSCTVRVRVENRSGEVADGYGNILLSDLWAWPSDIAHPVRDAAMRAMVGTLCRQMADYHGFAHPLEHFFRVENELSNIEAETGRAENLPEPFPRLAALVCLSPIDAAVHDACGAACGLSAYSLCGPETLEGDLARFIGPVGRGHYASEFLATSFAARIPVWHLVGGVDKLRASEKSRDDPDDGLPVSLDEWIERDGIFCFKVKLRGSDIDWDVERTAEVAEVAGECLEKRGGGEFFLSVDSNEQSPSPDAVIEYLTRLKERSRRAFDNLLYVEQPTERDLEAKEFDMSGVAALKPVLADEGITDLDKIDTARRLGWSGIALKTCKCHSAALLAVAKASLLGMRYSVQDLTNVGLGLVHSVGLAARITPIKGVEYNSRQFLPMADEEIRLLHPRLFNVKDGFSETCELAEPGLGYAPAARARR